MNAPLENGTLVDHLTELRFRLVRVVWILLISAGICWSFVEPLMATIQTPIRPYLKQTNGGLVFTGVADSFFAHLKLALLAGVVLSCPLWLYQVWRFVAPGLYQQERRYALVFIGFGSLLFLGGVSFAYFLVLPAAFGFLLTFGEGAVPMITISEYLSFVFTTALVFGASFELPLIMFILGALGLVSSRFLRDNRRYAVVIMAAVAGVVTPPDLLSMVMLLIPLVGLFELGILLVRINESRQKAMSGS